MTSDDDYKLLRPSHAGVSYMKNGELIPSVVVSRAEVFSEPSDEDVRIHVLADNERIDWLSRVRDDLSFGFDKSSFQRVRRSGTYATGEVYLASFKRATVDLRLGFLVFQGSRIWEDSLFATIKSGPVSWSPAIDARADERWFSRGIAAPKALSIKGPAMMFCHWATSMNYGHWLMNSLLPVYQALDELRAGELSLIAPQLPERWRNELLAIGVPPARLIESVAQYVDVEHLIYPSHLSTAGNMFPAPSSLPMFETLKKIANASQTQSAPKRIYVSRLGAGSRVMSNEEELIAALAELGFVAIHPHRLSFDDQIKVFSEAEVIIGQFGAALWSMPFAPRGGAFIEISTTNYGSFEYLALANIMGRELVQIMVEPSSEGYVDNVVFRFEAPIPEVLKAAKSICGASFS